MSTETTHSYFDQKIHIDSNSDVIFELHDPRDRTKKLPIFKTDLNILLDGFALMFLGDIDSQQFIRRISRQPIKSFCSGCQHYIEEFDDHWPSRCTSLECVKIIEELQNEGKRRESRS